MTDTSDNVWGTPDEDHPSEPTDAATAPVTEQTPAVPEEKPTTRRETRKIETLEASVEELRVQLATARADLANHQNRKRKDLDDQYEAGRGEVISNLIPVLDNIAGANDHGDLTDDNALTPVLKTLTHTLEGLGLGAIAEVGEDFDPHVHEALTVEYSPDAEGTKISKVHQRGYATNERLLRPALVTVVKKG